MESTSPVNETDTDPEKKALPTAPSETVREDDRDDIEVRSPDTGDFDTLVISGGSIKGIAALGALQYAQDNYLLKGLKYYVGTSCGALICYLLAIGYSCTEIMVYLCTNQLLEKMSQFNIVAMIQGRGAISFTSIHEQLEKMTIAKIGYLPTMNDLRTRHDKTLVCITHNLNRGEAEYLSYETHPHLPCLTALRMSCNLPFIFEVFSYGNEQYVDGGISDNFGIQVGEHYGKKILGIVLDKERTSTDSHTDLENNIVEFLFTILFTPIQKLVSYKIAQCSEKCKVVRLSYSGTKLDTITFNVDPHTKLEMFSTGYEQMREALG
jgi:predicted acylesterase/phospholipase RssA